MPGTRLPLTPLRLEAVENRATPRYPIVDPLGVLAAYAYQPDDAAYIVRAVNVHTYLVNACHYLLRLAMDEEGTSFSAAIHRMKAISNFLKEFPET